MPPDATVAPATTPRPFVVLLLLAIAAALVPTIWPAVDLALAGLFTGASPAIASAGWWWVEGINLYIPAIFRALLVLCFLGWLVVTFSQRWRAWRLPLAFVVLALSLIHI